MKRVYLYLIKDKYFCTTIEQNLKIINTIDIEDNILSVSFSYIDKNIITFHDRISFSEYIIKESNGKNINKYELYSEVFKFTYNDISIYYCENLPIVDKFISIESLFKYLQENPIEQLKIEIYKIYITNQTNLVYFYPIEEIYIPFWNISINNKTNILFNQSERYTKQSYKCNDKPYLLETKLLSFEESKQIYNLVLKSKVI